MNARKCLVSAGFFALLTTAASADNDLICASINDANSYGAVGSVHAYSFGHTICNIGDGVFDFTANQSVHPVFTSSIYRLQDGRLEQIGIGFVSHTFFPLQSNACSLGCNAAGIGQLGPGCSDASGSGIAGSQVNLGPRSEVEPYSGDFVFPFTSMNQSGDSVYKRVKVDASDIADLGALYFVESQYLSNEELTPDARNNNASYRRMMFSPGASTATLLDTTADQRPAIYAWLDHGNGVDAPDPDVMISEIVPPSNGVIHVASRAHELTDGSGSWRYDYSVHNQNNDRGMNGFAVPIGHNRGFDNPYFNDVDYADDVDGDIDGTDWMMINNNGFAQWGTGEDFDQNPLSNAIRWGTTYTFSFVSIHPPTTKSAQLRVFKQDQTPGEDFIFAQIVAPQSGQCPADFNADGILNFFDVSAFLASFTSGDLNADFTGDAEFDFFDVSVFLNEFSTGCP